MLTDQPLAGEAGRRFRVPRAMPRGWVLLLMAIPFLAGLYLLLPMSGPARTIVYPAFGLIGMLAILVGVHRRPSERPGSWRLVGLAFALLSLGDITYSVLALVDPDVPYPSLADAAYLSGYVALIGGVVGLIRGRVPGGDRAPIIDAAILAAGVGSIVWITIILPNLEGAVDPIVSTVSMAYPGMDVILLALVVRVLLTPGAASRYLQILMAGLVLYLVGDVIYALALLDGSYVDAHPVDAVWIVAVLLVGVAALHPSVADRHAEIAKSDVSLSRARLALLAVAALIAPTILVVHEAGSGDSLVLGLVIQWTLLFGLVLVRLTSTVNDLGVSLQQRRRLQGDLAYQAHHDPLTRLANRLLFEIRLNQALATAPESTAVVFLDLDDFKAINDTLGHATGDELLRVLAGRIQRALRGSDLAARLGGDEFAILVEGCESATLARVVAERALASLRTPVGLGGRQLSVHASAGVAMGRAGSTATDLMRDADVAMYQAKSHGKDQVEAYETEMHGQVIRSYELRTDLAQAIESKAFVLHYQPIIHLESGEIVGAEALVRWNHPSRGFIGPDEFIPQAESSGMIHALGRLILREACRTAAGWPDRGGRPPVSISVNLAASQLHQPSLVDDVAMILAETGLPAARLVLEVTESALVDLGLARDALLRLRDLGVRLALDDFGTGYSALSYLAELPFDIVKIDQRFVAGIGQGRRIDALLEGILRLCASLELTTVAEGIEHGPQLARLRALGCRIGQGYLFARPMPAGELRSLLDGPEAPGPSSAGRRVSATSGLHGLVGQGGVPAAV